jgi:oligopeptide/dipeptide ABC transporter ATP-binding protein
MSQVEIPAPDRRYNVYPHELSGGLRQRVMIAIALSGEPQLILCDEPTTALDVTIQDQILRLLRSICERFGVSLVYVTHDLAVITQVCETIAVMYAGKIVESGPVEEVLRSPRHPYTAGLLRSVPDPERPQTPLRPIPGRPPDMADPPPGCRFHPRCPLARFECAVGDFPLASLPEGRATACIHHTELADFQVTPG